MLNKIGHIVRGAPTCRSAAAFLLDYVEGRLGEKTSKKFEKHIAMCPNCERFLQQYRATVRMVKDIPPPQPPPELADMTCEFIKESLGLTDE